MKHWTRHGPGPDGTRVAYCICGWLTICTDKTAAHSACLDHRESVTNDDDNA